MIMAEAIARREIVVPNAPALTIASKFGRYGPMEEKTVRTAEVSGDELTYLRQRREMLRSMTLEQALQVIEFHKDSNVFEALALARKQGKVIVPNDVHDRIFTETDNEYRAWTGTAVIYEAPGMPFGEKVVYRNLEFEVPQQFIGKTNCALVAEHPDFELIPLGDNNFRLKAAEGSISLLERFPKKSYEWYEPDKKFRIPIGNPIAVDQSSRFLWRTKGEYVGLVARVCNLIDGGRRGVGLGGRPSGGFGVALF
jgi:hypothetical protein